MSRAGTNVTGSTVLQTANQIIQVSFQRTDNYAEAGAIESSPGRQQRDGQASGA
jgi:hypothetical protein